MSKPADLVPALTRLSAEAVRDIDITRWQGMHPCIGSLDVCPVVWTRGEDVEAAKERAIETAGAIGETGVPVFLYGSLASSPEREERSFFREGGIDRLWQRMGDGSLEPDFGPALPHATAGATLVTARPPLAAFNVELDSDDIEVAKAVAAKLRENGEAFPGQPSACRSRPAGPASTNVHDRRSSAGKVVAGSVIWRSRSGPPDRAS
jgi:glutamate formiminotransferase